MKKLSLEKKIIIGIVLLFITIGAMFLVTNNKREFSELKTELAMYEYNVENKFIVTNGDLEKLEKELENQKQVYSEKLEKYNKIIEDEKLKTDKKERNVVEDVKYKEELINNYLNEKYKELDFKKRTFKDGNEDEMVALGKINSELEKLAEAKFEDLEIEQKQELITNYQNQIKEYEKLKKVVENRIAKEQAEKIAKEQVTNPVTSGTNNNTASANTGNNNSTSNVTTNNNNNSTNNTTNNNGPVTSEKVDNEPNYNGSSFYSYGKCPEENYPYVYNFVVDKCYTRNVPALCSQTIGENMFERSQDAQAYGIATGRGWQVVNCGDNSWRVHIFDACSGTNEECSIAPEWS